MKHSFLTAMLCCVLFMQSVHAGADTDTVPLTIGETFTLYSKVLDEERRINVFTPTRFGETIDTTMPVLYMPDGGMGEDFLHIAGLLQISVSNGTMRPFLLVGIENTERARDMTGPTEDPEDLAMAPRVGESAAFRKFIRDELFAEIERRYRTTDERAIIGESLAGLFVVETLLREPDMFDTYLAADPSLWWNRQSLTGEAGELLANGMKHFPVLYIAASHEAADSPVITDFIAVLEAGDANILDWHYRPMEQERHSTLYHPAALDAFRTVFRPAEKQD